ncbi:MAG TPA: type II secretion system secretin GspD [Rudaea sp.]|nr:type II secretion system secretin GspD [Rudaea sp.]
MSIRPHILSVTCFVVLLAGCATAPVPKSAAVTNELQPSAPTPDVADRIEQHEDENPIKLKNDEKTTRPKPQLEPGTGSFVNEQAARAPIGSSRAAAEGQITFNFENEPIQAAVQAILGSLLKENYTVAPNVTGNVTFSTSKPITPEQAMPILEMLLAWTNNTLVRKDGRYEVVPIKDAIPGNLTPRVAPPNIAKGYEVRVFPLKYISASEMQKLLKPYAKADAIVNADNARNMIVMAGTASELANYQRTIEVFDVDWLKGMSIGVFSLRNMDVTKVMPELDKVFGAAGESPLAGMFRFIPMETTNAIVVITPQPEYLKQAESWIYRLDTGAGENGTQLYVYDVKNVKAVDLSDHLNSIFTGRTTTTTRSSASGNVAPGLRPVNIGGLGGGVGGVGGTNSALAAGSKSLSSTTMTGTTGAAPSNLSTTGTGAPPSAAGQKETDIRITPIEENNQLLVMATPGEWDSILSAIHRLDVSPLQVQIETRILEVTLTGDLQYGVQWWLAGLINNNGSATGYTYDPNFQGNPADRHRLSLGASSGAGPVQNGGLFYSFLNKNMQVALNALQTSTNTKILSAPSMVVLNNQEAQINVGTQVPILSTSIVGVGGIGVTSTTSTNGIANTGIGSSTYINTGVVLDVKPRVNPGGLVYMDVSQEVSSPGPIPSGSTTGNPPINQRQLQTQIAVQSGQTVLLGGLISETDNTTSNGLPLIASIPILGKLFGNTNHERDRQEIIVLITPRVITNSDEARQATDEYEAKFESLAPLRANKAAASQAPTPAPLPPEQPIPPAAKDDADEPPAAPQKH